MGEIMTAMFPYPLIGVKWRPKLMIRWGSLALALISLAGVWLAPFKADDAEGFLRSILASRSQPVLSEQIPFDPFAKLDPTKEFHPRTNPFLYIAGFEWEAGAFVGAENLADVQAIKRRLQSRAEWWIRNGNAVAKVSLVVSVIAACAMFVTFLPWLHRRMVRPALVAGVRSARAGVRSARASGRKVKEYTDSIVEEAGEEENRR